MSLLLDTITFPFIYDPYSCGRIGFVVKQGAGRRVGSVCSVACRGKIAQGADFQQTTLTFKADADSRQELLNDGPK